MIKSLLRIYRKKKNMVKYCRNVGMAVGKKTKISSHAIIGTEPYLIAIGRHCEITAFVNFVTHDGGVWVFREEHPDWDIMGRIIIEDNVYIGNNAVILPNVRIGENSVIGAGAVVSRSIPPNCVAVGVPARVVKSTEEYKEKCRTNAFPTKRLSIADKRAKLQEEVPDPK